jgi:beta-phosphoglucomutase
MIKAVIFDMDGVLIEAKEWHYIALNKALSFFGIEISLNDHKNFYDGLPTKIKLEALTDESKLPHELHSLINRLKQKYTMELIYEKCKPTFHHEFLLNQLKKENFLIGLASNSIRDTVNLMLNKANLSNYFDIILSNEDVKKPKPDKEIYEKIIQHFNILPSEALVVEDHDIGIQAAKQAGAYVLKVDNTEDVNFKKIFNEIKKINQL